MTKIWYEVRIIKCELKIWWVDIIISKSVLLNLITWCKDVEIVLTCCMVWNLKKTPKTKLDLSVNRQQ